MVSTALRVDLARVYRTTLNTDADWAGLNAAAYSSKRGISSTRLHGRVLKSS